MPKVYIVENPQPNAFATGRDPCHAAVCVTRACWRRPIREELAGVIAHELGHVPQSRHADHDHHRGDRRAPSACWPISLSSWAGPAGQSAGVCRHVAGDLLAPFAAVLVQTAISRSREFEADRAGAKLTGRPLWLANALAAIDPAAQRTDNPQADANPATAHMFIVNPLHGGIAACSPAIRPPRNASRGCAPWLA